MKYYSGLVDYPHDNHKVTKKMAENGKYYVRLEIDRKYNPEKKYNVPVRVTIGVLDENDNTKMHPNENFKIYFPDVKIEKEDEESNRSQCLRVGAYSLIKNMFNETKLNDIINPLFKDKGGLIKDLVSYEIIEESNVMQHFEDYEYNHPLFNENMHIYSDSSISDLLSKNITPDDINTFINAWTKINKSKGKIYISYDSTNSNCQAMDIDLCEMGHAKLNPAKPIVNLSIAFDEDNKIPLFYELYSGSIPDISCIETMINKAKGFGFNDACFILDRGYFSKNNIRNIVKQGYDFLIAARNREGFIDDLISECDLSFKSNRKNRVNNQNIYGTSYKKKLFGLNDEVYVHVFFNAGKYPVYLQNIENDIAIHAERLNKLKFEIVDPDFKDPYHELIIDKDNKLIAFRENEKAIEDIEKYLGYFVLITSEKMTYAEAFNKYSGRDQSEKLFKSGKSFLGGDAYRVHTKQSLESKTLITFIALIIRNAIYNKLMSEKYLINEPDNNIFSVPEAIKQLEKVEMIKYNDTYRLSSALSRNQKKLLKAFNMNSGSILMEAQYIAETLKKQP